MLSKLQKELKQIIINKNYDKLYNFLNELLLEFKNDKNNKDELIMIFKQLEDFTIDRIYNLKKHNDYYKILKTFKSIKNQYLLILKTYKEQLEWKQSHKQSPNKINLPKVGQTVKCLKSLKIKKSNGKYYYKFIKGEYYTVNYIDNNYIYLYKDDYKFGINLDYFYKFFDINNSIINYEDKSSNKKNSKINSVGFVKDLK
jgi:hypothetical protein